MARSGEYSVDHAPPTAEYTLADIDAMASSVLNKVRDGSLPRRGSSERTKLTVFMAVQIGRDLDAMVLVTFFSELFDRFDSSEIGQIGIDDMRSHMISKYGFTSSKAEVEAAVELANLRLQAEELPTAGDLKRLMLKTMFDSSIQVIAPRLETRQWSLEVSKQ